MDRLGLDVAVPGGSRLTASVRRLQEEGRAVALVAARNGSALAASDLGIAVPRSAAAVPWGGHVICMTGLKDACLMMEALSAAHRTSSRSAALTAAAASVAVFLALVAPSRTVERRALTVLGLAAIGNLGLGTWSAVSVGGRPPPVPAERTPWHAMPPEVALRLLGSSSDGLEEAEAARRLMDVQDTNGQAAGIVRSSAEELANPVTAALAVSAGVSATVGSLPLLAMTALRMRESTMLIRIFDASA